MNNQSEKRWATELNADFFTECRRVIFQTSNNPMSGIVGISGHPSAINTLIKRFAENEHMIGPVGVYPSMGGYPFGFPVVVDLDLKDQDSIFVFRDGKLWDAYLRDLNNRDELRRAKVNVEGEDATHD